ncbi:sialate O-acetylesterase [Paenibacillus fonticola]|uniref:sialate O-acetylesterase n=1 Tax=Paenibacillus fonticola TaxID=379896 RepID=UPI00035E4554|nr:sialate O-acetylesterase [Paenibacillus fonticola]
MKLHSMLSDGMVLQRNIHAPIWGRAESGEEIKISFLGKKYSTSADAAGQWRIVLEKLKPGGPHEMRISSGQEELIIRDILIGDVWVLGGQSNMELPVRRTLDLLAEEVASINLPLIRQFAVPQTYNFHAPQQELSGGRWIAATPEEVLNFSAAGFFCAQELFDQYQVPIGLVQTAVGGTPIEAWMSEATLRDVGGYEADLEQCKDEGYIQETMRRDEERNSQWYSQLNDTDLGLQEGWFHNSYDSSTADWGEIEVPGSWAGSRLAPVRGTVWLRKEIDVPASMLEGEVMLKLGTIIDADDTYINGICIGNTGYMYPPRRYSVPKGLLKPGRNTIVVRVISSHNTGSFVPDMPYKLIGSGEELDLRGVWQYRIGTSTEELAPSTFFQYKPSGVFNSMIAPLREFPVKGILWYQGESNSGRPAGYRGLFAALVRDWRRNWGDGDLPFIYVQLANFGEADDTQVNWAELREEQRRSLEVPRTAMAVTIDVGEYNDLHPQDKKTVGQRLALCARKLAYGEEQLVHSGPMFKGVEHRGNTLVLHFDHIGSGLVVRGGGGKLHGFAVCGPDGRFCPAQAVISGDTVIVRHEEISQPVHARYAWANNPAGVNLYNREGLPASPFSTSGLDPR